LEKRMKRAGLASQLVIPEMRVYVAVRLTIIRRRPLHYEQVIDAKHLSTTQRAGLRHLFIRVLRAIPVAFRHAPG
jgi:hypothetical protein